MTTKYRIAIATLGLVLATLAGLPVWGPAIPAQSRQPASEASLSLVPPTTSVQSGDVFTLTIAADTGANSADTADAYIDFDPDYLEVVDESGEPATTIEPNAEIFTFVTVNTVDNGAGQINFSGTNLVSSLTGAFPVATVRFRAAAPVNATAVAFVRSGARTSDLYRSGESLDATLGDATVTISSTEEPGAADLAITKSGAPDPVEAGGVLTYTLDVHNAGPDPAAHVVATDTLPSGVAFVRASGDGWTCNQAASAVTCTRASLDVGSAPAISTTITAPSSPGVIINRAIVSSDTADPNPDNNSASESITVPESEDADLSITKSADPDPVAVGGVLTYTLAVINNGPADATGVVVTDTLPAGVTFGSATPSQGTCSDTDGVVVCNLNALTSGAQATVTAVVTPTAAGAITNTAQVAGHDPDPDSTDNTATATTTVASGGPRLALAPCPVSVLAGQTFTLTVVAGTGARTADTVDAYLDFDSTYLKVVDAAGDPATEIEPTSELFDFVTTNTVDNGAGQINFSATRLDGSLAGTFTVATVRFRAGTPVDTTEIVFVQSEARWSELYRSGDALGVTLESCAVTLAAGADLSATKSASPEPVAAGHVLTYTVAVANNGSVEATGVVVTDTLPASVSFANASGDGWTCNETGGAVICTRANLAVESAPPITISVTAPASEGIITNSVIIRADTSDPNPDNNVATLSTTVVPPPPVITVTIDSRAVPLEKETTLPLLISGAENLGSVEIEIRYDPSVLDITACNADPDNIFDTALCIPDYDNDDTGTDAVRFTAISVAGASGDAVLAEITMQGAGQLEDCSPLEVDVFTLDDVDGNPADPRVDAGQACIRRLGDVNLDNAVNATDAMFILQYRVGLRDASDEYPPLTGTVYRPLCDVNGNAECNSTDALFILQCFVGIPNPLCPASGSALAPSASVFQDESPTLTAVPVVSLPDIGSQKPGFFTGASPLTGLKRLANHVSYHSDGQKTWFLDPVSGSGPVVSVGSGEVAPGDVITVPLEVSDVVDLASTEIEVQYDPAVLDSIACQADPGGAFDLTVCNPDFSSEALKFTAVATAGVSGDITLAEIAFRAVGQAGDSSVVGVNVLFFVDEQGQPIEVSEQAGEVTVVACRVGMEEVQTVAGLWRQAGEPPYDCDGDGVITIKDIMCWVSHLGGTCP